MYLQHYSHTIIIVDDNCNGETDHVYNILVHIMAVKKNILESGVILWQIISSLCVIWWCFSERLQTYDLDECNIKQKRRVVVMFLIFPKEINHTIILPYKNIYG